MDAPPVGVSHRVALLVATGFGAGLAPIAPGTVGSAVAVPFFVLLSSLGGPLYILTIVALLFLGVWAADVAEREYRRKDDGRIVVDEVVGQLVTLSPLLVLGGRTSISLLVTGFVVFRVFDIWKPGPARAAEQRFAGGLGVVLDDVVAGVFGAIVLTGVALLAPALGRA